MTFYNTITDVIQTVFHVPRSTIPGVGGVNSNGEHQFWQESAPITDSDLIAVLVKAGSMTSVIQENILRQCVKVLNFPPRIIEMEWDEEAGVFFTKTPEPVWMHCSPQLRRAAKTIYSPLLSSCVFTGTHIFWEIDTLYFPKDFNPPEKFINITRNLCPIRDMLQECVHLAVTWNTIVNPAGNFLEEFIKIRGVGVVCEKKAVEESNGTGLIKFCRYNGPDLPIAPFNFAAQGRPVPQSIQWALRNAYHLIYRQPEYFHDIKCTAIRGPERVITARQKAEKDDLERVNNYTAGLLFLLGLEAISFDSDGSWTRY